MAKKIKIEEPKDDVFVKTVPTKTIVVNVAKLNVREKATKESKVIKVVNLGTELKVFEEVKNGFYELYDANGFVMADYVTVK